MFVSFELLNQKKYEGGKLLYKIIDSDFEEQLLSPGLCGGYYISACYALIEVYEKRKIPVAPNLAKFLINTSKKNNWQINQMIEWYSDSWGGNKEVKGSVYYFPSFHKYKDDLNKYLILL